MKNKKVIVFTARVHPGEAASNHFLKAILDQLLDFEETVTPQAEYLRENYFFVIIPMLNPDGVAIGNARCALPGIDYNETWNNPDRFVQPEIFYAKKLLIKLKKENEIVFFGDLHATLTKPGAFAYGHAPYAGQKSGAKEMPFILSQLTENFGYHNCR